MMNLTIAGIALAVSAALGGWAGHHFTALHYQNLIGKQTREAQAKVDAADERALNAASDWEVWASIQRPKAITITREVERAAQDDPDCSQRALPPRLRDALTAAAAAANQPKPDGAVSPALAARPYELGPARDGLFRSLGGTGGVQGEAPGTR